MTPLDRAKELIALRQKATAGVWHNRFDRSRLWDCYDYQIAELDFGNRREPNVQAFNNSDFIAAAANHVVEVCEALEAAERRNAELVILTRAAISLNDYQDEKDKLRRELNRIMGMEAR